DHHHEERFHTANISRADPGACRCTSHAPERSGDRIAMKRALPRAIQLRVATRSLAWHRGCFVLPQLQKEATVSHDLTVRFLGVRGSIATPGPELTAGGNTSCLEVCAGDTRIILDAGTGLRTLGNERMA